MAKFIKSFFNATERRRGYRYEESEEDKANVAAHLDGRRKLSISRSGRMRQSNKKRQSLSLELYNQDSQTGEKAKSNEVQVNQRTTLTDGKMTGKTQRSHSADITTPEEEIDIAFEIIDKAITADMSQY